MEGCEEGHRGEKRRAHKPHDIARGTETYMKCIEARKDVLWDSECAEVGREDARLHPRPTYIDEARDVSY